MSPIPILGASESRRLVIPPHGPLVWLYPHLQDLEGPAPAGADVLDLRNQALCLDALIDLLRAKPEQPQQVIELPLGERSRCLVRCLRERERRRLGSNRILFANCGPERFETLEELARRGPPLPGHPDGARLVEGCALWFGAQSPRADPDSAGMAACFDGILPVRAYGPEVRLAWRALVQQYSPGTQLTFLEFEQAALLGIDLYARALGAAQGLESDPSSLAQNPAPKVHPPILAICGIDGSGKSSHLDALEQSLQAKGLRVQRLKLYRHGIFHDLVSDLSRGMGRGRRLDLWVCQRRIKFWDSLEYFEEHVAAACAASDVLLFDRYVFTHWAMARSQLGDGLQAEDWLLPYPEPDLVVLLDLPAQVAIERLSQRSLRTMDENPLMLERVGAALLHLAQDRGLCVLDAQNSFEHNRAAILEASLRAVAKQSGP